MSVILLCVTGLFLRSLESASSIDIGFRSKNVLMMSVDPRLNGYTPERIVQFLNQVQQREAAIPGVLSAVFTDVTPLSGGHRSERFHAEDQSTGAGAGSFADLYMVTPGYFDTLGIPRISGSDFGGEIANGPKTAIVNQIFVQRIFAGRNPIGQQVTAGHLTYQIIGVVGNVKSRTLGEDVRPVLYRSLVQSIASDPSALGYTLLIHTAGNPASALESVQGQIHALDPQLAVFNEETMQEHVRTAFFLPRVAAMLFGTFGFIGLVLAAVGLYGVMSYAVSRRTREIGIRMALGAKPGTVERMVLRQGMVITLIAVVLGWPVAWMLARVAASFLYGIQPRDALTFAVVPPFLAAIALIACWIPARRAALIDPMKALRTE
jgi:predicted permease